MEDRINIQEFYNGLDLMFEKKDRFETKRYLESWLRTAEEKNDIQGVVAVSNELGGLCRATGELDRAKALYKNVLDNLEKMGLAATEHYATALINTADVHINAKEHRQALELFLKAQQILKDCGLGGDYRMAALCNNISAIYRETGEFAKAEQALDIAFHIIKGLPQYKGELATTYTNLAELQIRQNKLEMAKESLIEAIKIFEEETGGKDVHYSAANASLGEVFFWEKNYREAEKYYTKALQLIERDFGRTPYYELVSRNLERVRQHL
ncbi:tetratricopeptide repeat protein [Anaerovorax odorimutans]|uniref:Tetratricopeptide repeat protein n=1 Tax=Anaerovorax odorimutans TaxID=109327 RepID=A0ABT1RIZ5_9FIRM|nr:tetratricopeptide repeat protein [Anaerovorax odorimutans]MCQ4635151.1 tetratricopeptide repeat protein [Anaerovorax odorimutans]